MLFKVNNIARPRGTTYSSLLRRARWVTTPTERTSPTEWTPFTALHTAWATNTLIFNTFQLKPQNIIDVMIEISIEEESLPKKVGNVFLVTSKILWEFKISIISEFEAV